MNDQHHPGSVRLQSSAVVLAALITTLGAVTAACIQTGWLGKPAVVSMASTTESPRPRNYDANPSEFALTQDIKAAMPGAPSPATLIGTISALPRPQATFTGTIEPVGDSVWGIPQHGPYPTTARLLSNAPPRAVTAPASTSSEPSSIRQKSFVNYPPNAEIHAGAIQPAADFVPASPPADATTKVLNSPWSYLSQQPADSASAPAEKPAKKSLDWSTVARFFQGH